MRQKQGGWEQHRKRDYLLWILSTTPRVGISTESGPRADSPTGYCKHSLLCTLAELLSRQPGTKQPCVTWEAWPKSQWSRILFLAAGMYTVASWRAARLLTGKPRCVSVSCSWSLSAFVPRLTSSLFFWQCFGFFWITDVAFSSQTRVASDHIDGEEVRIHGVTDFTDAH